MGTARGFPVRQGCAAGLRWRSGSRSPPAPLDPPGPVAGTRRARLAAVITRAWHRIGPWLTPALVVVEVALVTSGLVSIRNAVVVGVVIEAALWVTVLSRVVVGARRFRAERRGGFDRWAAAEAGLAAVVPRPLARFILLEPHLWACLVSWALRRPGPAGPGTFRYDRGLRWVFILVIALVVVEGAVVDGVVALVAPGTAWVWVVLGVHLYALAMLLALRASFVTHPHLLAVSGLQLRDGVFTQIDVPAEAVVDARPARRANVGRSGFKINPDEHSALLAFGDATAVLTLDPGHPVTVNGQPCTDALTALWVSVDDPGRFAVAVLGQQGEVDTLGLEDFAQEQPVSEERTMGGACDSPSGPPSRRPGVGATGPSVSLAAPAGNGGSYGVEGKKGSPPPRRRRRWGGSSPTPPRR